MGHVRDMPPIVLCVYVHISVAFVNCCMVGILCDGSPFPVGNTP